MWLRCIKGNQPSSSYHPLPQPSLRPHHYITQGSELLDKHSHLANSYTQPGGRAPSHQHGLLIAVCSYRSNSIHVIGTLCGGGGSSAVTMSRNNGKASKLEFLRMGLSRARGGPSTTTSTTARPGGQSGNGGSTTSPRRVSSSSSSTASPPSSCVSSEGSPDAGAGAPVAGGGAAPMVLAGCPRCMMYVMLSREDPRCPRCHNAVLLDFNDGDQRRPRQRR